MYGADESGAGCDAVTTLRGAWVAAVEEGGRGDGAAALTALARVAGAADVIGERATCSLAWSTTASLHRQCGRHAAAAVLDGRALAVLTGPSGAGHPCGGTTWVRAARADALVGLAADNLGLRQYAASARLLKNAAADCDADDPTWTTGVRCLLRWHWVHSELGTYSGNRDAAVRHARAARELIARHDADQPRHRIKTRLIGAASTAADAPAASRRTALSCADEAADHGLVPLEWAASALAIGLGNAGVELADRLAAAENTLRRRGMPLADNTG